MTVRRLFLVAGLVLALAAGLTLQGFARTQEPEHRAGPDLELTEAMEAWVESLSHVEGVHVGVFDDARLIMVSLGEKPTGGYDVTIQQVTRGEHGQWLAEVKITEPGPDDMVTQAITYPYALVAVEDGEDEMPVRVIDVDTGEAWDPSTGQ